MKNILLITTPWEENPITAPTTDDETHYPIGLAYLHSYLESKGYDVDTLWLNNADDSGHNSWRKTLSMYLNHRRYFVVGFNVLTMNRTSTYEGIEYVHENYPNLQIVLGGIHATIMYEQIIKKYPYVIVIRGEGEITFVDLLGALENHTSLFDIPGIAYYYHNGMVIATPDRELIEDLDILPFPEHHIFFSYRPVSHPRSRISECTRTFAGILTSRGCPNQCSFCCLNPVSKRTVRFRSIPNVIKEVQHLIKNFPTLTTIWIHDDSFFLNNNRVIEFCDEIIRLGIKIDFVCSGRVKPLSPGMILKLGQAGFKTVMLGLESGDNQILNSCHKGITQDDVTRAVELFAKSSIDLVLFLIVGLPGETIETITTTAKFIQKLQKIKYIFYQDIGILMVYPGTEVYQLMKDSGKITDDYWMTGQPTPVYTANNSAETLYEFKNLVLDHIAIHRVITINGFIHQWYMILWSVPYVFRRLYKKFGKI